MIMIMWTLAAIAGVMIGIRLFVGLARVPWTWNRSVARGYLSIYVLAVFVFAGYLIAVGSNELWTLLVVVVFGPGLYVALRQLSALGRS
ncbi:hypothetical protein [Planomonospora parontospora]|nr:hypothetical protein [Planomonospora parontospora]